MPKNAVPSKRWQKTLTARKGVLEKMNDNRNQSNLNSSDITEIVVSSLQEVIEMGNGSLPDVENLASDTRLIGREAVLDSMGLVNLIVEVEQRLEEEFDVVVVLADERAMSQKQSPFRSVQSLADYIAQLVQEQG
jgi:acyl carrier protein